MDKRGKINWGEFFRIFFSAAMIGGGAIIAGSSGGKTLPLIGAVLLVGAGIALLVSEKE